MTTRKLKNPTKPPAEKKPVKQMIKKTIIKRSDAVIESYTITYDNKPYDYKIQEPTFDQLSYAMTESTSTSGRLNMSGGGKVIFELCCLEYDPEIEKNPKILMSVCFNLYDEYVLPEKVHIKKN